MSSFSDKVSITVLSGNGGAGKVSFSGPSSRKKSAPDGGDGGDGGSVVIRVRENLKTLAHLQLGRHYKAESGEGGKAGRKNGKNGSHIYIDLPPYCVVKEESGVLLCELKEKNEEHVLIQGGRGGKGNLHFKSSRMRTPRFAQEGEKGSGFCITIELQLSSDYGFIGLPNSGKSSLLQVITNAHPKIDDYPFTTSIPYLGMCRCTFEEIKCIDFPAVQEGSSKGKGLGFSFLQHLLHTRHIIFVLDATRGNLLQQLQVLEAELSAYSPKLMSKPSSIVVSKSDACTFKSTELQNMRKVSQRYVQEVSAHSGKGITEMTQRLCDGMEGI